MVKVNLNSVIQQKMKLIGSILCACLVNPGRSYVNLDWVFCIHLHDLCIGHGVRGQKKQFFLVSPQFSS